MMAWRASTAIVGRSLVSSGNSTSHIPRTFFALISPALIRRRIVSVEQPISAAAWLMLATFSSSLGRYFVPSLGSRWGWLLGTVYALFGQFWVVKWCCEYR